MQMTLATPTTYLKIVASLMLVLALPAQAIANQSQIYVDSASTTPPALCGSKSAPCETIDDAMQHAHGGEQVIVAAGDYSSATISVPVHLVGAQAGISGPARLADTPSRTTTIHGMLTVRATVSVDGFEFRSLSPSSSIYFAPPINTPKVGASVVTNNTFVSIAGVEVIRADNPLAGLTVIDNLFVAGTGAATTALSLHGNTASALTNIKVERNQFKGFSGFCVDASNTPGLIVRLNSATSIGSLLRVTNTASSAYLPMLISENQTTETMNPAFVIGRGVEQIRFDHNRMRSGAKSAFLFDDSVGTGQSSAVNVNANDIEGFSSVVKSSDQGFVSNVILRGNRLVDVERGGARAISNPSSSTIDAQGNWWGASSGVLAGSVLGADVSMPLRLVGISAPAAVLIGASAVVSVSLVGPIGGEAEQAAGGFAATFATTNGEMEQTLVPIKNGQASVLVHASSTPGETTTVATLDSESVSATTKILPIGSSIIPGFADPSVAETMPDNVGYTLRVRTLAATHRFALSRGLRQQIFTSQRASVTTLYTISAIDARRIGLRTRRPKLRTPVVIARVSTSARSGNRIITARIPRRIAFGIGRYNQRLIVTATTNARTNSGYRRRNVQKLVLPASVR